MSAIAQHRFFLERKELKKVSGDLLFFLPFLFRQSVLLLVFQSPFRPGGAHFAQKAWQISMDDDVFKGGQTDFRFFVLKRRKSCLYEFLIEFFYFFWRKSSALQPKLDC